jgi:hypothetical protein
VPAELALAARAGLGLVAVASGAASVGAAFNRYLVNDDYSALYTAWQESLHAVPGRDFVVYSDHAFMHALAALMRWFPESFTPLYLFRLAMVPCLGAIGVLVFRITTRLCGVRSAWFAVPLLALSTVMLNRALDLRSDLLSTLLWVLALDVLMGPLAQPEVDRRRTARLLVKLGLVLGLMPVNFFKAALSLPFFFAFIAARQAIGPSSRPRAARLRQALADVGLAAGASLLPIALYAAYLLLSGALPSLIEASRAFLGTIAGASDPAVARAQSFHLLLEHDPWIAIAMAVGVVLRLDDVGKHSATANAGAFGVLGLAGASVLLNPGYYAYNLVTLLPLLAPFGGYACARLLGFAERSRSRAWLAPLAVLALLVFALGRRLEALFDVGFVRTNVHQLALHRYLMRYVPPDQGLFALDGVGVFRPSVVHFWLIFLVRPRYEAGEFSYEQELRDRPAALVLKSYRVPWWLTPRDRAFLDAHYVDLNRDFMVPGAALPGPGEATIELLVPGAYDVTSATACRVDGVAVSPGHPIRLERGPHTLASDARCVVRLHVEPEARALLEVPTAVPYLAGPDYIAR